MRLVIVLLLAVFAAGCASDGTSGGNKSEAARANTQLGVDYMRQGKLDLAMEKLQRAIDQDDSYAPAHSTIALLYQQEGDNQDAEKHYRRALSLDSSNPEMRNNFGVFLCGQGRAEEADRSFMEALQNKRYSTPEAAWTNAGICAKSYDRARAEQYFREALRVSPEFPDALAQMAIIAFRNKDYLHARAFVQRYEVAGRPNPEIWLIAVRTEQELGDVIAAHKYEQRLKRDFPESPEAAALAKSSEP